VILLRPDRIVGGASRAYAASDMVRGFDLAIGASDLVQQTVVERVA
jgi:3-(3-hydroxy-phenyl)propionate hydroxylase